MTSTIHLRPREERRIRSGHHWVFSNEIASIDGDPIAGELVRVQASAGRLLGVGLYNPNSLIAVRITSRAEQELDAAWFGSRVQAALRLRELLYPRERSYRLIHSESDDITGVIVDRFDSVLAVQIASLGMEQRRDLLFDALMQIEGITGIVERNDTSLRGLEGLPERVGVVRGDALPQIISDGVIQYHVDPLGGQKTGFYLDQRENRIEMRRYITETSSVLDLFANSGGFAMHAADSGAARVIAVDSSASALAELQRNAELNRIGNIEVRTEDVFAVLGEYAASDEHFDMIIADPPPFARSKKFVTAARRRYVELFTASLRLLSPDGIAFFSSCSHHITSDTFAEIIRESLSRSGRRAVILEERGAAPDHPVHPMMPETKYLHGAIVRVLPTIALP